MNSPPLRREIIVVSSRPVTHADGFAVSRALGVQGFAPVVVDALLRPVVETTSGAVEPGRAEEREGSDLKTSLRRVLLSNEFSRAAVLARGVARDRRRWRERLQKSLPAAVVLFDDRRIRPELVALEACRQHSVPAVLVPFAVSTVESDLYLRRNRRELEIGCKPWRRTKDHIMASLPGQVRASRDGRQYTFFTPLETLLLKSAGLLPASPWVWGGAGADRVCALGEDHVSYLVEGGVAPASIVRTGQPSLDALAKTPVERGELRARLATRYGFSGAKPIVMCAVPQHGEHALTDWTTHWRLTDELFQALSSSGADVALSLHPKSRRSDYEARAETYGLTILVERLSDVLPAADVLTGTFSSTIPWATGLSIPAIVVDALDSNYELFRDHDGIEVLRTHKELLTRLRDFRQKPTTLQVARNAAERGSLRVGRIDGRNAERVANVIGALVARNAGQTVPARV